MKCRKVLRQKEEVPESGRRKRKRQERRKAAPIGGREHETELCFEEAKNTEGFPRKVFASDGRWRLIRLIPTVWV